MKKLLGEIKKAQRVIRNPLSFLERQLLEFRKNPFFFSPAHMTYIIARAMPKVHMQYGLVKSVFNILNEVKESYF